MDGAGALAKSVLALKYAAHDFGEDESVASLEALKAAAREYYGTYETYKQEREN